MSVRILMIDNYDSFTYNLVHYLEGLDAEVVVKRNDEISVAEALKFTHIVLSPGPGVPKDAGIMPELLKQISSQKVLGICLGHQAIAEAFGGSIYNMSEVKHGVPGLLLQNNSTDAIFKDLPPEFEVGRYHSWSVKENLPKILLPLATEKTDNTIMAMKHQSLNIYGFQFHPESVLTPNGKTLLSNWLTL